MFSRYALRTLDVDAARAFYAEAIGLAIPDGLAGAPEGSSLEAWPLHERARAGGAPPHWLGHVGAPDLDRAVERFVELGAEPLGPRVTARDGTPYATLRDPFGAVLAVCARSKRPTDHPVAWHQLHTRDVDRAWAAYAEIVGWVTRDTIEAPDLPGGHRLFAFREGGELAGSMGNTARWPGVHPHWLFCFPVPDVAAAVARVRALGGASLDPVRLPDGTTLAACDDPQGAAFGLVARAAVGR